MQFFKTFNWRLIRRRRGPPGDSPRQESRSIERLSALVLSLRLLEKAAEATPVPYLKGAIGMTLVIAECALVGDEKLASYKFLTSKSGVQI